MSAADVQGPGAADAVELLVERAVAAVVAADAGEPLPDPGDDGSARRVHRVVEAIAAAREPEGHP